MHILDLTSGKATPLVRGNGLAVHHDGSLSSATIFGTWPIRVDDGDAIGDNPRVSYDGFWLGIARDLNLAATSDQPIAMNAALYIARRIIIGLAAPTPVAARGGIYTRPGKAGDKLVDLTLADTTALTTKMAVKSYDLLIEARSAPYLYLALDVGESLPCKASIWVLGDALITSDDAGTPP